MVAGVLALLLSCSAKLAAGESYRLETDVYVFKQGDFRSIKLPSSAEADAGGSIVFHSPATLEFDQEKLSLAGAKLSWSGDKNPPDRFSRIETPTVALAPGRPVSLLSTLPVQYLEKFADGSLRVHEIPKDSPDAPHWRLTFTLETGTAPADGLRLACDVDVASVLAREKLPGVTLPVGKPVLSRFNETIDLTLRPQEWSAFIVPSPKSDYTLLTLLKIVPAQVPGGIARANRLMTAHEIALFATYYYQHPQPDLIARAIESLEPSGLLERGRPSGEFGQRELTCVGFFAEVFAANPDRTAEWRKVIERAGSPDCLKRALKLSRKKSFLALKDAAEASDLDFSGYVCWGAFFASGNPAYVRKLVNRLSLLESNQLSLVGPTYSQIFRLGAVAMSTLAYNAPHHPLVRQTLDAARKTGDDRFRKLIDDILNNDLATVRRELWKMKKEIAPHAPDDSSWLNPQGYSLAGTPQNFGDNWDSFYGRR